MEQCNECFGDFNIQDTLKNNAPYYVHKDYEEYSIWKNGSERWCNGKNSDWACASYGDGKDICSLSWYYWHKIDDWKQACIEVEKNVLKKAIKIDC